jgi:hypothetical protein
VFICCAGATAGAFLGGGGGGGGSRNEKCPKPTNKMLLNHVAGNHPHVMHRHIPASSCVLLPALFIALLSAPALAGPDLSACSVRLYEQTLDHFSFSSPPQATFKQRYVVCDRWWSRGGDGSRGPIFFYFGNEADVFLCATK